MPFLKKRLIGSIVLLLGTCQFSAYAKDVWMAQPRACVKQRETSVPAFLARLQREWGKDLEIVNALRRFPDSETGVEMTTFIAGAHTRDGVIPFVISDSLRFCNQMLESSARGKAGDAPKQEERLGSSADNGSLAGRKILHAKTYRPYFVVSSKLNRRISGSEFETLLACRNTLINAANTAFSIENFDVIRTGGDSSMGIVTFAGLREGKAIEVAVMTTTNDRVVKYIWVDGTPSVSCVEN